MSLSTVVLVERTHNRFPIKANYVGLSLATTLQEYIKVEFRRKEAGSISLLRFDLLLNHQFQLYNQLFCKISLFFLYNLSHIFFFPLCFF